MKIIQPSLFEYQEEAHFNNNKPVPAGFSSCYEHQNGEATERTKKCVAIRTSIWHHSLWKKQY